MWYVISREIFPPEGNAMRSLMFKVGVLAVACVSAAGAYAAPISCGGTGARVLTIDTAASGSCIQTGIGNLGGDGDIVAAVGGSLMLDRDDSNSDGGPLSITGVGGTSSGSWSFTGSGTTSFLFFHFGNGGDNFSTNPDYFIFQLATPTGSASGTWSTGGLGSQWNGLSNVAVVSGGRQVPEPATLGLLGMGLAAVGLARRRKKS